MFTRFVSTRREVDPRAVDARHALGERARVGVVVGEPRRGGARGRRAPPAARMPACRIAPPQRLRKRRASTTSLRGPQNALPTGAPRPFEKHTLTVSKGAQSVATSTPQATLAFQMRAPSRCVASPSDRARSATARACAAGHTRPPARLCVFSIETSDVRGAQ